MSRVDIPRLQPSTHQPDGGFIADGNPAGIRHTVIFKAFWILIGGILQPGTGRKTANSTHCLSQAVLQRHQGRRDAAGSVSES